MTQIVGFEFEEVVVVAESPHDIFSPQLRKAGIKYKRCSEREARELILGDSALIIVVNLGAEKVGERLRALFPRAQVVVCTGGEKVFDPRVVVVHGKGEHDLHRFSDWGGFIRLIGQRLKPLPRIFTPVPGGHDLFTYLQPEEDDYAYCPQGLSDASGTMLNMSIVYLRWYRQWLEDVSKISFDCHFSFSGKKRKVRRVTVLVDEVTFIHLGLPIFHEEDRVTFFDSGGNEHRAIVERIGDEEMKLYFPEELDRFVAEDLVFFQRDVDNGLIEAQLQLCENFTTGMIANYSLPWLVATGQYRNQQADPQDRVCLPEREWRRLSQDRSQCLALVDMVGTANLVFTNGPAGTGKTFVISQAIPQNISRRKVTLVLSHSNRGLDNMIAAIAKRFTDHRLIYRLGNSQDSVAPEALPFHRSQRFRGPDDRPYPEARQAMEETRNILEQLDFGDGIVIGCTLTSFWLDKTMLALQKSGIRFQVAYVDEASRCYFFELLPILRAVAEKVIFVLDPEQLGNIGLSPQAKDHLVQKGFEPGQIDEFLAGWPASVIKKRLLNSRMLTVNRRSLPVICRLVSEVFYDGELESGRFDPNNSGQVIFYDTAAAQDKGQERHHKSFKNRREANIAVSYVVKRLAAGTAPDQIGIITPYRGQIGLIRGKLRQELLFNDKLKAVRQRYNINAETIDAIATAMVDTVDAFQGSERTEIILSFVRSNDEGDVGFNRFVNRLLVAFSRARNRLVIIGDTQTFLASEFPEVVRIFKQVIEYVKKYGTYVEVK
ncbi:MAG: DEAD/DEAH box helicase [Patescibacteria group bacterium]|jgi:hypothetical protein